MLLILKLLVKLGKRREIDMFHKDSQTSRRQTLNTKS